MKAKIYYRGALIGEAALALPLIGGTTKLVGLNEEITVALIEDPIARGSKPLFVTGRTSTAFGE